MIAGTASDLLGPVDFFRLDANRKLDRDRKSALGQFLTPEPVARLMASMLRCDRPEVRILDAGAGVGTLFAAGVSELCRRATRPSRIRVTAYEVDAGLASYIPDVFSLCRAECDRVGVEFSGELRLADFLLQSTEQLDHDLFSAPRAPAFDCAILNPPYRKIRSESEARRSLRRIGIETTNLYSAFLAIAARLLGPGGEMVAITPRSFCNGPYFRRFRRSFLETMALRGLHIFESRQDAFRDDEVLQENVILHAEKGAPRGTVSVSLSDGPDDGLVRTRELDYRRVVRPDDPESFIHIAPDEAEQRVSETIEGFRSTLGDLGLAVSTGRVVDFRARESLRQGPGEGSVPLIHPTHLSEGRVTWPKVESRKPNAIAVNAGTRELLVPSGNYVLTRRFTAKEERRRVVAAVFEAERVPCESVGFENHLNYYHRDGRGLGLSLARGLAAYLNSSLVDRYFRQFNGHTQVNATDLRNLRYPGPEQLESLGAGIHDGSPAQAELDDLIERVLPSMAGPHDIGPTRARRRIEEALGVLKDLGFPRPQLNELSALTLLALLDLEPDTPWSGASEPLCGITPMMEFFAHHYGKIYKPNTRETVRRQTVHQFLDAGLIVINPDQPGRPVNSPKAVYRIERTALELLRSFGTDDWDRNLRAYLASVETLRTRYAREREMARIPVRVAPGRSITLSPGGQNVLIEQVIHEFAPRFAPGGRPLYVGDADEKFAYLDRDGLAALGVEIEAHGKMPDVVIHHAEKDWLVLIEAVTSHGPIDPRRRDELTSLFRESRAGPVFVTAFLTRKAMVEYLGDISWETEVWVAESPTHMIHFNGERFLGPDPGVRQERGSGSPRRRRGG